MSLDCPPGISSGPRSAIDLVKEYPDLLIFPRSGENEEAFWDAADQPPVHSGLVLDESHPALVQALSFTELNDLLDFLTHSCLLGRQGKEDPMSFTHATPHAAQVLAQMAMSLNVANVFRGVKEQHVPRVASDAPLPMVYPSRMVALVPVFDSDRKKRVDLMMVCDPREGGFLVEIPDPFAPVISVAGTGEGYPHEDEQYRRALNDAFAPSPARLREMQRLMRNDLQRYLSAYRRAVQRFLADDTDDLDGGGLN